MSKLFEKYGGKATFFLIGESVLKYGDSLVNQLIQRGFEIENHSFSHTNLTTLNDEEIKKEIMSMQELVRGHFGVSDIPCGIPLFDAQLNVYE